MSGVYHHPLGWDLKSLIQFLAVRVGPALAPVRTALAPVLTPVAKAMAPVEVAVASAASSVHRRM